jgi:hypothetical protein
MHSKFAKSASMTPNFVSLKESILGYKKTQNFMVIPTSLIKKKIKLSSYIIIQKGSVEKSYLTNGSLIYGEIFAHFLIYKEALPHK